MYVLIYISIILCLYFFFKKKKALTLFFFVNISTGFGFISSAGSPIYIPHLQSVVLAIIIAGSALSDHKFFSCHKDAIGRIVSLLFVYMLLHLIGTIILRIDTPKSSIMSWLINLSWLMFFYVRTFNMSDIKKFFILIVSLNVIQGFFYYLQFVGITGILNGSDVDAFTDDIRYYNQPFWSMLIILFLLVAKKTDIKHRLLLLMFFLPLPILSQGRGVLFALAAAFCVFLVINRQKRNLVVLLILAIFYEFAVLPMFQRREKNTSQSTIEELRTVIQDPTKVYANFDYNSGANLSFRIAMLTERILYLTDNPKYFLFGVGDIDENSVNNTYNFELGTYNENAKYGRTTLTSVDIDWVEPVIKYGFVGVLLYLLLYAVWIRTGLKGLKKYQNGYYYTAALYSIYAFTSSFGTSPLHRRIYIAIFCLAIISICYRRNLVEDQQNKRLE